MNCYVISLKHMISKAHLKGTGTAIDGWYDLLVGFLEASAFCSFMVNLSDSKVNDRIITASRPAAAEEQAVAFWP